MINGVAIKLIYGALVKVSCISPIELLQYIHTYQTRMKKLRTILQSTHLLCSVQQIKDEQQKEKNKKTECYTWKSLSSFPSQFFHFQIFRQLSLHNSVQFSSVRFGLVQFNSVQPDLPLCKDKITNKRKYHYLLHPPAQVVIHLSGT